MDEIIIWNPNTRKHVKVPSMDLIEDSVSYKCLASDEYECGDVYGFGYDSVSDDYKVVRVFQFYPDDDISFVSETNVFSMRSGSWRIIDDVPDSFISMISGPGVLVCGVIHWAVSNFVVALDVTTEEYTTVKPPDFSRDEAADLFVWELGCCLSIVHEHVGFVHVVDIWVMKGYGVKESWTKLITLSELEISRSIEAVIPLAYSECGDELALLLNNSKELLFYNLEKRTTKFVPICCCQGYVDPPMICLESLVFLGEKAENDEKQDGENEQVKEDQQERRFNKLALLAL